MRAVVNFLLWCFIYCDPLCCSQAGDPVSKHLFPASEQHELAFCAEKTSINISIPKLMNALFKLSAKGAYKINAIYIQ